MPSKGQPLHRRKRNLQKSRSRFVGNERRQKNSSCIVGNQTPRQSSFGRAREGRNPLAPRPRGGVGERSAPRPRRRERKSSREPFLLRRKRTPSKEQPCIVGNERRQKDTPCIVGNERRQKDTPCIVGNQTPRQTSPGRAREGRTPLAPRRPRECRGAERPTLAPSGKKNLKRAVPALSETNAVKRTPPASSETNAVKRTTPALSETNAVKRTPPASSETKLPARPAPGERERDAPLSHPVARGGVGERSAPRPASSETNPLKG